MTELMTLEVLSPGGILLRVGKVRKIIALLEDGQIGVFPGHTVMLAETVDGPLTYTTESGEEQKVSLAGGILKVSGTSAVIFSGGFFDQPEGESADINLDNGEQEFSRLTTELTRRLKLS